MRREQETLTGRERRIEQLNREIDRAMEMIMIVAAIALVLCCFYISLVMV